MTAAAAGDSAVLNCVFGIFGTSLRGFHIRDWGGQRAASPLHVMHQDKKRGRPQIRTAEYWREYYTRKPREWRAAHPAIRTSRSNGNSQITAVRASAALAARHTTERE